jgi:hypothetical protein
MQRYTACDVPWKKEETEIYDVRERNKLTNTQPGSRNVLTVAYQVNLLRTIVDEKNKENYVPATPNLYSFSILES